MRYPLIARPPYSTLAFEPVPGHLIQTKVPVKFATMTRVSKKPAAQQTEEEAEEDQEDEAEEDQEEECADQGGKYEDDDEEEEEEKETDENQEGEAATKDQESAKEKVSAKEKAAEKSISAIKRPASALQRSEEELEVQGLYKHQALKGNNIREYILVATSIGKKHCVAITKKESNNYKALMRRLLSEAQTKVDDGMLFGKLKEWANARKAELMRCLPREPTTKVPSFILQLPI